jgi:hypothetical protein
MFTLNAYAWAEIFFRASLKQREDNHNTYRGLALALWMKGSFY